jgi:NAD(P)H-dependent FMN reductase
MKIRMKFLLIVLITIVLAPLSTTHAQNETTSSQELQSIKKVGIIIGSTRPGRLGEQVAQWISDEVSQTPGIKFSLIDLAAWNLPLFNEPGMPSKGQYTHDYTRKWSKEINAYDAFIFVTPEYNGGYPASMKNAIDYLYKEWTGKPAIIVSYGYGGGEGAAAQLRQVLEGGIDMRLTKTMPAIRLKKEMLKDGKLAKPDQDFVPYIPSMQASIEELKTLIGTTS